MNYCIFRILSCAVNWYFNSSFYELCRCFIVQLLFSYVKCVSVRHNILLQPITNIFHYHLVRQLALFASEKFDDTKSVTISRKSKDGMVKRQKTQWPKEIKPKGQTKRKWIYNYEYMLEICMIGGWLIWR